MTEQSTQAEQQVVSYEAECMEIKKQIDALSEKFKEHYENVIKPLLPELFVKQVENAVLEMEEKNKDTQQEFDYTNVVILEAHKESLKTMQAMVAIYGIQV